MSVLLTHIWFWKYQTHWCEEFDVQILSSIQNKFRFTYVKYNIKDKLKSEIAYLTQESKAILFKKSN